MSVDGSGEVERPPRRRSRSPAARVLEAGARGAERLAGATGVDKAIEDATEEAIVRALRSPAVERAIVRVLVEQNAVQRGVEEALTSDEMAEAIINAIDSDVADRVWEELLASPKVQMLVERIAEAPEVRAAITQQGVGLVTDLGRRLTAITERLDDAAERLVHGIFNRPGHEAETNQVGLVTRAVAAAIDLGLISLALSIGSGLLASIIPAISGGGDGLSIWGVLGFGVIGFVIGGTLFVTFWALIGQTPGMRLLSIHLDAERLARDRAAAGDQARARYPALTASVRAGVLWRSCSTRSAAAGMTASPAPPSSTTRQPPTLRGRDSSGERPPGADGGGRRAGTARHPLDT